MSCPAKRLSRCVMLLGLLMLVAGCTRIPLSSLWALKQFSFETFNPAVLRVAVRLPVGVALKSDALVVDSKVTREGDAPVAEHFVMHESREKADLAGLPEVSPAQGRWVVLKFDADEARRVRTMREGLMARKAEAEKAGTPKAKTKMEIGASPKFCRTGATLSPDASMAGAMYWAADKGYVMLMRETPLDDLLKDMDDSRDRASLPAC
jgi:hypothetical protein